MVNLRHRLRKLLHAAGVREECCRNAKSIEYQSRWVPYAQILVGGSHANGSLYTATGTPSGSSNGFATTIGGGIDMTITPHLTLRAIQADYFITLLGNGTNNRQNNLSLSAGVVFRFGSHR
jgi:hypothetical protein